MVCNHDGEGSSPSRSTIYPIDTPWLKRGESSLPWDRMFPRHVVHGIESLKRESQHKEVPAKLSGAPTQFRPGRGLFSPNPLRRINQLKITSGKGVSRQ